MRVETPYTFSLHLCFTNFRGSLIHDFVKKSMDAIRSAGEMSFSQIPTSSYRSDHYQ